MDTTLYYGPHEFPLDAPTAAQLRDAVDQALDGPGKYVEVASEGSTYHVWIAPGIPIAWK